MPDGAAWICVAEQLESRLLFAATDLDTSFSNNGIVTTDFGNTDVASAVVVQADGKVIVAGDAVVMGTDGHLHHAFAAVRYNADGTLDDGSSADSTPGDHFGTGGKFTYFEGVGATPTAMAIQSDGKILIAGSADSTGSPAQQYWLIVRLNPNGTFDKTFGDDGVFSFPFSLANTPLNAMALQSDGKIVAVGSFDNDFLVARLTSTGDFDETFNDGGTVTTDFGNNDVADGVAFDNVGNIVVAGTSGGDTNSGTIALARYEPNGTLDPNFGSGGKVTAATPGSLTVGGVVVQANGTIVVGDSDIDPVKEGGNDSFLTDGEGAGSVHVQDFQASSITLMADGRYALGGTDLADGGPTIEASITGGGDADISNTSTTGTAVAAGADGSVFVAGYIDHGGAARDFILAKFKGISPTSWGAVSGNVFRDLDGDHVEDSNEKGMSNVRVFVDLSKDGLYTVDPMGFGNDEPSALTDSHGNFVIRDVRPGTYVIREIVPASYTQSLPLASSYSVTVSGEKTVKGVNFANTPPITPSTQTALKGSVFFDWNGNGKRDISKPTEPDLAGEVIYIDANRNGKLDKGETQTKTDAGGNYNIKLSKAGTYRVAVVVPAGYTNSTPAFFDATVHTQQQVTERFGLTYADANDTISEAKSVAAIPIGKAVGGTIANPLDVNVYRFTVKAGQSISFDEDAASGSSLNAYLRLFDASGHQLAANDNAAAPGESIGIDSFLKFKFATAGTYYIAVSDHLNTAYSPNTGEGDIGGGTKGKYTLTLS
jgi:uncharacterized delta-60 repeat protein